MMLSVAHGAATIYTASLFLHLFDMFDKNCDKKNMRLLHDEQPHPHLLLLSLYSIHTSTSHLPTKPLSTRKRITPQTATPSMAAFCFFFPPTPQHLDPFILPPLHNLQLCIIFILIPVFTKPRKKTLILFFL